MNNDNTDYVSNESGTLSRLFKLPQHGTTVRTELIAGMTTFLTMVYIVFVNPSVLGDAGMDKQVVFVTESGVCYHLFDCRYRQYFDGDIC